MQISGMNVRLNRAGVGLLAVLALAFVMSGQESSSTKPHGGLVTDWTTRHLVFSSSGTPDMIEKFTKDPRYQMQWARRNFHPVAEGGAPESNDVLSADAIRAAKKKVGMQKDWGLEMAATAVAQGGLNFPAKYSFSTSTASCNDFVVYPVDVLGSSTGVAASVTGSVSGTPGNAQTATITNGANVDTVTTSAAVEATANGTVSGVPTNGQTATITNGANVDAITATAAAFATAHGTFTSTGMTAGQHISITGASGSPVLTLTAAGPPTGTITDSSTIPANNSTLTIGGVVYEFESTSSFLGSGCAGTTNCIYSGGSPSTTAMAKNIEAAINNKSSECGTTGGALSGISGTCFANLSQAPNADATATETTNMVTVTDTLGTTISFAASTSPASNLTLSPNTGSISVTADSFVVNGTAAMDATNLIAEINTAGVGSSVGVSAASGGSGVVNLTATAVGAGSNTIALANGTAANFAWSGANLSGGITQLCTTFCASGGVEYYGVTTAAGVADTPTVIATNMFNAFNNNANEAATGVTVTNPSAGAITVTATTTGSAGDNIMLSNTASNFAWAHSSLQGGASLLTGNQYVPITTANGGALTTAQIAANFVTAFNANVGSVGITASVGTPTNDVVITANATGASGDSIMVSSGVTNFAWGGSTLSGGSGGQASIIAYNNLYAGTPAGGAGAAPCGGSVSSPPVKTAWAYSTGGTVTTSPTISLDGTQVAFIQNTSSGAAQLVILKPLTNTGIDAYNNVNTSLTVASSAAVYRSCAAPCMYAITFALDNGTDQASDGLAPNGSKGSSLWEDYAFDVAYVGDDDGYVHQFTGVFTGDPVEVTTSPWPVSVCASPCGASGVNVNPLTSPIYDESRNVLYVGDFGGREDWIDVATGNVTPSTGFGAGSQDIYDAPLVDPSAGSTGEVYQQVQYDGTDSGIFQLAGEFAVGASGTEAKTGVVGSGTTGVIYTGSFDNAYYIGAATGYLYVCGGASAGTGRPALWYIPITTATNTMGTPAVATTALTSAAANCSSITETDNGSTDYIYTSVTASGNRTGCSGGCVMVFSDAGAGTLTFVAGASYTGGTSGIVIDNFVTGSGASNIYFSPLTTAMCTTTGSGGCAVQASQGPGL